MDNILACVTPRTCCLDANFDKELTLWQNTHLVRQNYGGKNISAWKGGVDFMIMILGGVHSRRRNVGEKIKALLIWKLEF